MVVRRLQQKSTGAIAIAGGTGSQGIALAYAASQAHDQHGRDILVLVRGSTERAEALQVIGNDGKAHKLRELPGVKVVSSLEGVDSAKLIVVATVPSAALASVLRNLPSAQGLEGMVATYNGTPRSLPDGVAEPEHVVSMFPSGAVEGQPSTYFFKPDFPLIVGGDSRVAKDLQAIFGTTFKVTVAGNALRNQWTKIATNTAANSLATLFGIKVGDLRARMDSDPSVDKLVKGVVAEVWSVARQSGVDVEFEDFCKDVIAKIPPTMDHWTSTGLAFRSGKPIAPDVMTFSAGVAERGKLARPPVKTPLCNALTSALEDLEKARGQGGPVQADFYQREGVAAIGQRLLSPAMVAAAEAAVAQAAAGAGGPAAKL
jgi:hypothetical protein